jgi:molybdenum-dependent DNA-binding transcriptional regulator ModE
MSQDATQTDRPLRPDQITVLELLMVGKSITAAAKQADISR